MKRKRLTICILLAVLLLLCTGCDLDNGGSLFALPELSGQYTWLQKELDKILDSGASYTVAATGTVRSSVQMADLDGDGREEAIGLFLSKDGVPEVHVFRMEDESCTWLGKLTGVGTGIREIRYFSRGTQGQQSLAVSWSYESNARYYGMTVAGVGGGEVFTMLDLQYAACLPRDLDGDAVEELTFVRPGRGAEPHYACVYQLQGGSYQLLAQTALCAEAQSVLKLRYASVVKDQTALVVDSGAKNGGYVTDVMSFDGAELVNLTRDPVTGSGAANWRKAAVPAYDINSDGLLELPVALPGGTSGEMENRVIWMALGKNGAMTRVKAAYHNAGEGWCIFWPEHWADMLNAGVYAEYTQKETMSVTTFYSWQADVESEQVSKRTLLTIWAFHGEDRVRNRSRHYAVKPLNESGEILYGYTLPTEGISDAYSLTDALVESLFCQVTESLEGGNT